MAIEFSFLGTLAGNQTYLVGVDGQTTYGREYTSFGGTDNLRKKLTDLFMFSEKAVSFGCGTSARDGGYFYSKQCLDGSIQYLSSAQYALVQMSDQLMKISSIPMKELLAQCEAYRAEYIIHYYFDSVSLPKEGNLVVYPNREAFSDYPAGIYKETLPNWSSSRGGTVESKWHNGFANTDVILHDLFFIPSIYGNKALFYEVKKTAPFPLLEEVSGPLLHPMCIPHEEGHFQFDPQYCSVRLEIDGAFGDVLLKKFPEIKVEKHIQIHNGVYKCFFYAMGKLLKIYSSLHIPTNIYQNRAGAFLDEDILEGYFVLTKDPKPGDFVVYSNNEGYAHHYGIYHSKDLVESKWGDGDVYRHPPFHVPNSYGNRIRYYRLRPDLIPETFLEAIKSKGRLPCS